MSNFMAFLGGAAQAGSKSLEEHDKLNREIEKAAMLNSLEAWEEENTKFKEIEKAVHRGVPVSALIVKSAGIEWKDLSQKDRDYFIKTYDTPEGKQRFLKEYSPSSKPTRSNYKDILRKDHPLVGWLKEMTGKTPNTAYARSSEKALIESGKIDELVLEANPRMPNNPEDMKLEGELPKLYAQAEKLYRRMGELEEIENPTEEDLREIDMVQVTLQGTTEAIRLNGMELTTIQDVDGSQKIVAVNLKRIGFKDMGPYQTVYEKRPSQTVTASADERKQILLNMQQMYSSLPDGKLKDFLRDFTKSSPEWNTFAAKVSNKKAHLMKYGGITDNNLAETMAFTWGEHQLLMYDDAGDVRLVNPLDRSAETEMNKNDDVFQTEDTKRRAKNLLESIGGDWEKQSHVVILKSEGKGRNSASHRKILSTEGVIKLLDKFPELRSRVRIEYE